ASNQGGNGLHAPGDEPVRVPRAEGSFMKTVYDVAVVGAGPYGLSTAAHLLGQGLRVAVFGRTLEMWREHMPGGMLLRSHWWATNLSDPRHAYGFALLRAPGLPPLRGAGRHRDRRRTEWGRVRRPAPRGRCRRPGRIAAAHQLAPAGPDGNARRARTAAGPGRGDRAWLGQLGVGPPALPVLSVPPIMEGPIQRQLPARSKRLAADQSLGQDRAPRGPNGGQCGRGERQSRCHTLRRRSAEC